MSSKEKIKCRKIKYLWRYYQPNPNKVFESYAYCLLFSFYPFRNEEELKQPLVSRIYQTKLLKLGIIFC